MLFAITSSNIDVILPLDTVTTLQTMLNSHDISLMSAALLSMSNTTHIMPVLVLLSVVESRNATSPPENCDLVTRNLGLVNAVRNFAIQHNFCSSFAQLRFGHKRSTSNGQCDNVILMEKGVDAIHSPHASLWTRSVSRSIMQKDTVQYCL